MELLRQLTPESVLIAAAAAAVITFMIIKARALYRAVMNYPAELNFRTRNIKEVMEHCCLLFPMETFIFKGRNYKRGMMIRVTTMSKQTFEGKLIGLNADNVLCVVAKGMIQADILDHITDISELGARS
ncbi:MAG: hypothetical protein LBS19_11325 [Clostridiales bacterium]|jgi:hypothetical protein|nr:hypothetical protein [Clostridiales bacterium]